MNSFLEVHQEYDGQNRVVREMVMKKCDAAVRSTISKYKWKRKHNTQASLDKERWERNKAERKRSVRKI